MKHVPYVVSCFYFLVSLGPMSHVNFKKWPCRRVEYRDQEPPPRLLLQVQLVHGCSWVDERHTLSMRQFARRYEKDMGRVRHDVDGPQVNVNI